MFHPKDHQLRWKEVPNATKSTKDSVLILLAMLLQTSNSTRTHVLLLAMLDWTLPHDGRGGAPHFPMALYIQSTVRTHAGQFRRTRGLVWCHTALQG